MDNRSGLAVGRRLTLTSGTAEWQAALEMIEKLPWVGHITVGGDKGYDMPVFGNGLRKLQATPHVEQKAKGAAIAKRTTRNEGYQINLKIRKRIEEIFGWIKTVGGLRKTRHQGLEKVDWMFTLATTAYNLVRMRNLIWAF